MQNFRFGISFIVSFLFLLLSVHCFEDQKENGDWGNLTFAVIMNKIREEHHKSDAMDHNDMDDEYDNHRVTQFLDHVSNPVEVASELDSAAKYLIRHQEEQIKNGSENEAATAAVELTRVLDGFVFLNSMYDSVVRPAAGADGPTVVSVDLFVYPFNVDEEKNEMTVTVTLIQNWTDPRLEYRSRVREDSAIPFVTLTSYMHLIEMWFPDTCLYNEKWSSRRDLTASPSDVVRVSELGNISREQRMSVTLNCPFSQRETFPFDTVTCSLRLTSFSWSKRQVLYRWAKESSQDYWYNTMEFNGLTTMIRRETDFERRGLKAGNASSGLIVDFVLQREVTPFVMKIFLPLALFCVISLVGLVRTVGAEIGTALSYFVFGIMNIFMGVSFTGPRFVWGSERTALDLYYVLSVVTVLVTGLVNIFRLSMSERDDEKLSDEGEEFEMRGSDTGGNLSVLGARNLESGSENGVSVNTCGTAGRVLKAVLKWGSKAGRVICRRVNDSSSLIVVGAFICWNLWFWAAFYKQ